VFTLALGIGSLVGAGVAAGLLASLATNRLLMNRLWNTSPYDPFTMLVAVLVIAAAALAACYVPAVRAARRDPITALRLE
jgi:ABC-type antimicrobial peptide transport system permease subunit